MKNILMILLLGLTLTACKKKENYSTKACTTEDLLQGKWKFVSRIVTKYGTNETVNPASNLTINFDSNSYIEFTADNKFTWRESYGTTVYRNQKGRTLCANGNFLIYGDETSNTGIVESITELTTNKLVFSYNVLSSANSGSYSTTVVTTLSK